jgi:hypothetical protein
MMAASTIKHAQHRPTPSSGADGIEDNPDGDPAALEFELLFAVFTH